MLIYHPAYDAYHCVFRALALMNELKVVELPKLRILDFFLCFPGELKRVRLPVGHNEARKISKTEHNPYHGPVSYAQAFRDMEQIQMAAYSALAASRLVEPDEFESGLVRRTSLPIPDVLHQQIMQDMEGSLPFRYLTEKLAEIPLLGENGLKHRTGLMEYRYDAA